MHILLVQSNVVGQMDDFYLSSAEEKDLLTWLEANRFVHVPPSVRPKGHSGYWIRDEKTNLTFLKGFAGDGLVAKEVKSGLMARFITLTSPSGIVCKTAA